MVISSQLFAELDGLDEGYSRDFGDIDICLRAIERGLRVVWTPFAVLTHRERSSFPQSVNADDRDRFIARWASRYGDGDPFYHPAFRTFSPEFPYSYELRLDDEPAAVPYGRREATKA
jgi:GT2 family glycosyltransferase